MKNIWIKIRVSKDFLNQVKKQAGLKADGNVSEYLRDLVKKDINQDKQ